MGSLVFVMLVALLNLGLGFTIARVRRSAARSRMVEVVPTTAPLSSPSESMTERDRTSSSMEATNTSTASGSDADSIDLVERFSEELEHAEQRLSEFVVLLPEDDEAARSAISDNWDLMVRDLSDRLQEFAATFKVSPASTSVPEVMHTSARMSKSLQELYAGAASVPAGLRGEDRDFRLSATQLIHACQEARGTVNALQFSQL